MNKFPNGTKVKHVDVSGNRSWLSREGVYGVVKSVNSSETSWQVSFFTAGGAYLETAWVGASGLRTADTAFDSAIHELKNKRAIALAEVQKLDTAIETLEGLK